MGYDELTHPPRRTPATARRRLPDRRRRRTDRCRHEAELAASTRETYDYAWRQWQRWCRGRGINPLPVPPEALAAFSTERAETGLAFGSLDGYCSGIAHRHHQEGLPDPTADVVVRRVRRGLRRIMGVAPRRQAHPLTVVELGQIVASIDTDTAIGTRDRAILLVG